MNKKEKKRGWPVPRAPVIYSGQTPHKLPICYIYKCGVTKTGIRKSTGVQVDYFLSGANREGI